MVPFASKTGSSSAGNRVVIVDGYAGAGRMTAVNLALLPLFRQLRRGCVADRLNASLWRETLACMSDSVTCLLRKMTAALTGRRFKERLKSI